MDKPHIISGKTFIDLRGELCFVNDFNFNDIKRFYTIRHKDTSVIRAWHGHKKETKYFFPLEGVFRIGILKTPYWGTTNVISSSYKFNLSGDSPKILVVPSGMIFGIKALEENSQLLVLSDKTVDQSKSDDFRWDCGHFDFDWN